MLHTTTNQLEDRKVKEYLGVVSGDSIIGANAVKDFFASITDIFGGRSGNYEKVLNEAKENALNDLDEKAKELGADSVVGVDLDYEVLGKGGGMLMVSASGTAVKTEQSG